MSSFPNKSQYTSPVFAGAGVALVGSFIPILNYLNIFLLWYIVGGLMAAYMLRKRAPDASTKELAAVGALAALVASILLTLLYSLGGCLLWAVMLSDAHGSDEEAIAIGGVVIFVAMWVGAVTLQPLAGALGGLLGGAFWPVTAGIDAPPPTPEQLEAQKAQRSKVLRIVGAASAGCLLVVVLSCGGLGYVGYLESRDAEDTAGSATVVDLPITASTEVAFELPDYNGRYVVWLVADGISSYEVQGRWDCSSYAVPTLVDEYSGRSIYSYSSNSDYPTWHFIGSENPYGSDLNCIVRVTAPATLPAGSRIVVTEQVKPSDWLD